LCPTCVTVNATRLYSAWALSPTLRSTQWAKSAFTRTIWCSCVPFLNTHVASPTRLCSTKLVWPPSAPPLCSKIHMFCVGLFRNREGGRSCNRLRHRPTAGTRLRYGGWKRCTTAADAARCFPRTAVCHMLLFQNRFFLVKLRRRMNMFRRCSRLALPITFVLVADDALPVPATFLSLSSTLLLLVGGRALSCTHNQERRQLPTRRPR